MHVLSVLVYQGFAFLVLIYSVLHTTRVDTFVRHILTIHCLLTLQNRCLISYF